MWSKWTWRKIRALPEPSASAHGRRSHFGLVLFILFLPGAFFVLFGASQKKNPEVLASFRCWIQPGSAFPCFSLTLDSWAPKGEGRRRNKVVLFHFWRVKSSPGSFPAWRNLKIPFFWLEFHWKRGNFAGGWGFGRGVLLSGRVLGGILPDFRGSGFAELEGISTKCLVTPSLHPVRKNLLESSVGHKEGNDPRFRPREFQGMELSRSTRLIPVQRSWIDWIPSSLMALSQKTTGIYSPPHFPGV